MIRGYVLGGSETITTLRSMEGRLGARILQTVKRLAIQLQAHVKKDKLTGQVLHVRTGTLRRSVSQKVEQSSTAVTATVGTNLVYAPPHEFGFQGTVNVREHLRLMVEAFGKQVKVEHQVLVRAHSRAVNLPERSFLRSALEDMREEIREELKSAVLGTLQEGLKR